MKLSETLIIVRVDGEVMRNHRKERLEHYDADIEWLLNDAPGLLGESGVSYNEGGGSRVIVDTGPYHARAQAAMWAVSKARRLTRIWRSIDADTQTILAARYVQRRRWPIGFEAHFGELTGVVVVLYGHTDAVRHAASNLAKDGSQKILSAALIAAQRASRAAHKTWRNAYSKDADKWAET